MEYTLSPGGTDCVVQFTGETGIMDALEIKTLINDAISNYSRVTIDIEKVQEIDMTIIQLFCSANQSFEKTNKILTLLGADNAVVKASIDELGYDAEQGCSEDLCETCLWKGNK